MPNYNQGKIYIIHNTENNKLYVGSTTLTLGQRLADHKNALRNKRECKMKLYEEMRRIGEDKFYIELIKNYPCNSKEELNAEEGKYIREHNCFGENGLNKLIAGRDEKTFREEEKERINKKRQDTYNNNEELRERIKARAKAYHEANRDKVLEKNKARYEENKLKVAEQGKAYREANKEKIVEKRKTKVKCPHCDVELCQWSLRNHIIAKHTDDKTIAKFYEKQKDKVECEHCHKMFAKWSLTKHIKKLHPQQSS